MKCNTTNICENMYYFLEEAEKIKIFYKTLIIQSIEKILINMACYLGLSPSTAMKRPLKQLSWIHF